MVDKSALGAEGVPFEMVVEMGKVREFARATFSDNPAYLSGDEPVMPPTFLTTEMNWKEGDADPWPLVNLSVSRGLHAEQEYEFYCPPPRAGSRLRGQTKVEDIYEKQGRRGGTLTFVVTVTEFHDSVGKLVARSRLTAV